MADNIPVVFRLATVTADAVASRVPADVAFVDASGNPVSVGGGDAPTTIPEGSLSAGAGIALKREESGTVTVAVNNRGITSAMLADGVAVSGPKGDKGENGTPGAKGADGKSVKALALTVDDSGKVTGGTMTLSDNSTVAVTVTTATA